MCYRTIFIYSCGHSEEVVTKCRKPCSVIIPKRCLATFKPPETKSSTKYCTLCSIKNENAMHEAKAKRMQDQFDEIGREARKKRMDDAKVAEETVGDEVEQSDQASEEVDFAQMGQSPLAEID